MTIKNEVPFFMEIRFCKDCKKNLLKKYIDIINNGQRHFLGGASGCYLETVKCCPEVNKCYPFYYQEAMQHISDSNYNWWVGTLLSPNEFIELNSQKDDKQYETR